MKVIGKRFIAVAVVTFLCGATAVFALHRTTGIASWGQIFSRDETVRGQVVSFIIDDRGAVEGFVLSSGEQVRFNPTLGEALVAANISIGADVSARGHAGTRTDFGREVRAREISFGGRTFVDSAPTAPPRPPHERRPPREPRPGQQPPAPPADASNAPAAAMPPTSGGEAATSDTLPGASPALRAEDLAPGASLIENVTVSGVANTYLVGARGEVVGVILSSGEQFHLAPHMRDEITAANNNLFPKNVQWSATGDAVRTTHGTSVRPRTLSIGDRTYMFSR